MNTHALMQAAVLTAPHKIELVDVARPIPEPDQVLIRMEGSGLCGSNLPIWQGRPWFEYPVEAGSPGHEGWGVVESVGRAVRNIQEGDRVAAMTYRAFAQFDVADANSCVVLPPSLAGRDVPGEPLACAMNVLERSAIEPGQTVAVVDIGFLGAVLVQLAARRGANVIAISRRPFSLEVAKSMGAKHVFELADANAVLREVENLTSDRLCERVIEATGLQEPLDLAAKLTRTRGRLIIAGFHQDGPRHVDLGLWNWRGLDVINAHEREPEMYVEGLLKAVSAMTSGTLDPHSLLTHRYDIGRIQEAFEALEERPQGFVKAEVVL